MQLFNIQHMCTSDGPGIRTTVFFKGCPLSCIWCHNPESKSFKPVLSYLSHLCVGCHKCEDVCGQGVHTTKNGKKLLLRENCIHCGKCALFCPAGAIELLGKEWSVEEILAEVKLDKLFYGSDGGVTVSGGEPFAQPKALLELLKALKGEDINICIETCGYTSAENIVQACKYTDTFLFDYKESDPVLHKKYTGVEIEPILKNLDVLDEKGASVILRCPIIPDCNMRKEHFIGIADVAKKHRCIKSVELMPYHPLGIGKAAQIGQAVQYENTDFLKKDDLANAAEIISGVCGRFVKVN